MKTETLVMKTIEIIEGTVVIDTWRGKRLWLPRVGDTVVVGGNPYVVRDVMVAMEWDGQHAAVGVEEA